ncbi:hypothetical protein A2U01_0005799, partial [Trifolium medium]|nr:hypothetical protein [Trifolium medium]
GPVVIGAGLGREDLGSIPTTAVRRKMEPLDAKTDRRTRLDGPVNRILVGIAVGSVFGQRYVLLGFHWLQQIVAFPISVRLMELRFQRFSTRWRPWWSSSPIVVGFVVTFPLMLGLKMPLRWWWTDGTTGASRSVERNGQDNGLGSSSMSDVLLDTTHVTDSSRSASA